MRRPTTEPKTRTFPPPPFIDFHVDRLDDLLERLQETKPAGAQVEVVPYEASRHSPCMGELTGIFIHNIDEDNRSPQLFSAYQHCPQCKTAVRIL